MGEYEGPKIRPLAMLDQWYYVFFSPSLTIGLHGCHVIPLSWVAGLQQNIIC